MAPPPEALPGFGFSRRDTTAILALAEKCRRQGDGVRVLALGRQPRDCIYCAQLLAGPCSADEFSPPRGIQEFVDLRPQERAAWPTLTLRRAVTRSRLFYAWKQAQYGGKPLVRDIEVRQLDWPGRRLVNTWIVKDCWAARWSGPAFDAMRTAVSEEELELYYCDVLWR